MGRKVKQKKPKNTLEFYTIVRYRYKKEMVYNNLTTTIHLVFSNCLLKSEVYYFTASIALS